MTDPNDPVPEITKLPAAQQLLLTFNNTHHRDAFIMWFERGTDGDLHEFWPEYKYNHVEDKE